MLNLDGKHLSEIVSVELVRVGRQFSKNLTHNVNEYLYTTKLECYNS